MNDPNKLSNKLSNKPTPGAHINSSSATVLSLQQMLSTDFTKAQMTLAVHLVEQLSTAKKLTGVMVNWMPLRGQTQVGYGWIYMYIYIYVYIYMYIYICIYIYNPTFPPSHDIHDPSLQLETRARGRWSACPFWRHSWRLARPKTIAAWW